jgi:opacity protein-like surface antigen
MRYTTTRILAAAMLVAALAPNAFAQERRGSFIIGGGYTAPFTEVRDHLGDGYNFVIGGQFNATPMISIEGLYSFNGLGDKRLSIPVSPTPGGTSSVPTDFFADMNMQYGTVNVLLTKPEGTVKPYGLAGMGVYYRPVKVTTPGVGYVPGYCDPWWYVCYPGGFVPVENIIGERSSTDFGMDFGGGLQFGMFFAEARYHYIWGPEVEERATTLPSTSTTTTSDRKANGQFLLVTFGLRY